MASRSRCRRNSSAVMSARPPSFANGTRSSGVGWGRREPRRALFRFLVEMVDRERETWLLSHRKGHGLKIVGPRIWRCPVPGPKAAGNERHAPGVFERGQPLLERTFQNWGYWYLFVLLRTTATRTGEAVVVELSHARHASPSEDNCVDVAYRPCLGDVEGVARAEEDIDLVSNRRFLKVVAALERVTRWE